MATEYQKKPDTDDVIQMRAPANHNVGKAPRTSARALDLPSAKEGGKMEKSYDTKIKWNELFTQDVIALKTGQREGHLGQWEYSLPESPDDPVRGAELWAKFLESTPEYYIMASEAELVEQAAEKIPSLIEEPVAFALLGIGTVPALERKDLKIVEKFKHVPNITAFDINPEYIEKGIPAIREKFTQSIVGGFITDLFQHGFEAPRGRGQNTRLVATMFGATLFNVGAERDYVGRLVVPETTIRTNLREIRKSLKKGDLFITTHDGNMDPKKVEASYRKQTEFATNLAHRIKRDTPYKSINPDASEFRVEFDQKSGVLGHYLTFDFDGDGKIQEYLANISLKVPEDRFLAWCRKEKFKTTLSLATNGVHLHALEAC